MERKYSSDETTHSKRATTSTMRQLSLLLLLSVAMLCSASTLRVKRDATAKDCEYHDEWGTTRACSQSKCVDLCFSEDCNQEVNNARDKISPGGYTPLLEAAYRNRTEVAKQLIAHSADVNYSNGQGETALHYAASCNSVEVANFLLDHSVNVDSTDNRGYTALHFAVRELFGSCVSVAKLLIAHSADLNATPVSGPYKGLTPLQAAEKEGHQEMVELLRNA